MKRTGRNDPCPCGSGKKYKRCCLRADEEAGATGVSPFDDLGPGDPDLFGGPGDLDPGPEPAFHEIGGLLEDDPPVVDEEGFRIVGPAQAMMDFAAPLLRSLETVGGDDPNLAMSLAMLCWNLAVTPEGEREPMLRSAEATFAEAGISRGRELLLTMVTRHEAMFPDGGRQPGRPMSRFLRERVIDDLPPWRPFGDRDLPDRTAGTATDAADAETVAALRALDAGAGDDEEASEEVMREFQDRLGATFPAWLERGGVEPDAAETLADLALLFTDSLYRYDGLALTGTPGDGVEGFLLPWIFRKASRTGDEMSAAPVALRALARYLDAAAATDGLAGRMDAAVRAVEPEFDDWLVRFHGEPATAEPPPPEA